jgi:AcrR family transcriptional regulator
MAEVTRRPRADAAKNRDAILRAAHVMIEQDGAGFALDALAAQAGVGPGTLHRHFPAKSQLLAVVLRDRLSELAEVAEGSADTLDASTAFFDLMRRLMSAGRINLALARAIDGPVDLGGADERLSHALRRVLARAQSEGGIRRDIGVNDLHAIAAGAQALEENGMHDRGVELLFGALRA